MRVLDLSISKYVLLLAITVLFTSCVPEPPQCGAGYSTIPGFGNSQQAMIGDYYDSDKTSQALDIFYDFWTDKFGNHKKTEEILSDICLRWEPFPFMVDGIGTTEDGIPNRANGFTESRTSIVVYIGKSTGEQTRIISNTSLFHEIVHIMLWNLYGEPDPDHEEKAYSGWDLMHTQIIRDMKLEGSSQGI